MTNLDYPKTLSDNLRDVCLEYVHGRHAPPGLELPILVLFKRFSDLKGISVNKQLPASFAFPSTSVYVEKN